eukprot:scaffold90_cov264-Pinguiococcus_pyrenoidosus.AAC.17
MGVLQLFEELLVIRCCLHLGVVDVIPLSLLGRALQALVLAFRQAGRVVAVAAHEVHHGQLERAAGKVTRVCLKDLGSRTQLFYLGVHSRSGRSELPNFRLVRRSLILGAREEPLKKR